MTRSDALTCVHEPFGDAFYYGPERMSTRYEKDQAAREKSGYAQVTYGNVMDRILDEEFRDSVSFVCPCLSSPGTPFEQL